MTKRRVKRAKGTCFDMIWKGGDIVSIKGQIRLKSNSCDLHLIKLVASHPKLRITPLLCEHTTCIYCDLYGSLLVWWNPPLFVNSTLSSKIRWSPHHSCIAMRLRPLSSWMVKFCVGWHSFGWGSHLSWRGGASSMRSSQSNPTNISWN